MFCFRPRRDCRWHEPARPPRATRLAALTRAATGHRHQRSVLRFPIAQAQGARSRSLVVVYLRGGNDALNTVIPYLDPFYYSRRPAIAIPAGQVLQIGSDPGGTPLGLHSRLTGLRTIFNEGRLAIVQRTGYANSSRSHF